MARPVSGVEWSGAGTVAVGPRTDVDVRQAADPNLVCHLGVSFAPRGDPVATLPSAAAEASVAWRGTTFDAISNGGDILWSLSFGIRSRGCRPE